MVGSCYLCGKNGRVHELRRESDNKGFAVCEWCALVIQRRADHSEGKASTLLTAANAMPGGDDE